MARLPLLLRLRHALFGCALVKHYMLDSNIERAVEVGMICPVCFREYPFRVEQ